MYVHICNLVLLEVHTYKFILGIRIQSYLHASLFLSKYLIAKFKYLL